MTSATKMSGNTWDGAEAEVTCVEYMALKNAGERADSVMLCWCLAEHPLEGLQEEHGMKGV